MAKNSDEIISNDKVRKPTAKKSFSLEDFKKKVGAEDVPDKPKKWIFVSDALKEAVGNDSVPAGYVTLYRGYTNSGKSTALELTIVSAQKMGILPIIIDTENNLGIERLKKMGFDMENNFYIMIDNEYLLENFGKKHDKNRRQAAIEDMAECIHYFLDLQENGELPYDLLFAIDSIGTLDCVKTINAMEKDTSNNNQWNAGAMSLTMKYLCNTRIPNSRKINKQYTNTLVAVQKVWYDAQSGGQGTLRHFGGEALYSSARYIIGFGGTKSHGTSKVMAVYKLRQICFGVKSRASIVKNHIDGDLGGISLDGEVISTPHGFIGTSKADIEKYKKEHIQFFRNALGGEIDINDIETKYESIKDDDDKIDFNLDFDNEK